jgi:hypothetical protein
MDIPNFEIETYTRFSRSVIWKLNRNYYHDQGIDAWRNGIVPHHLTSNAMVGHTYAEMILANLKDVALHGAGDTPVYIFELGAGHGRLAFHVLTALESLIDLCAEKLPPYVYVLTDMVEENLQFFENHPQFQNFYSQGILDVAYYDACNNNPLHLRKANKKIGTGHLSQPIMVIANYFFDSMPADFFLVKNRHLYECQVALFSTQKPNGLNGQNILESLKPVFDKTKVGAPFYEEAIYNDILENYRQEIENSHFNFPVASMKCLENMTALTTGDSMLLSIDKGFHHTRDFEGLAEPDIINHGSFSVWVNFHALGQLCELRGGMFLAPDASTSSLQCVCMIFSKDPESYLNTRGAYKRYVNDFGPDDFNVIKKLAYRNVGEMKLFEIIAILRLSHYDASLFKNFLPRIKQLCKQLTNAERPRLKDTLERIWHMYYSLDETTDLAYEIGGILFDMAYYKKAIFYFRQSAKFYGSRADTLYNIGLSHYQLREDNALEKVQVELKKAFPENDFVAKLANLNLEA